MNFLFVWKPGGAREPAGPRGSQEEPGGLLLAILVCFALVSDGPMVRDSSNCLIRKKKSPLSREFHGAAQGGAAHPGASSFNTAPNTKTSDTKPAIFFEGRLHIPTICLPINWSTE